MKTDCAAGVVPATARATYMASMKAAHDKFKVDRDAIEKLGAKIEALAKIRNTAVKKAMDDFKTAAEAARATLKAALGVTPTPTATP